MAADKADRRANDLGPLGEQLTQNVRTFRTERGLSTRALAERLEELGRPIPATGITRVEASQRRVDVDDLVALAVALEVSPVALLLPPERSDEVAVTSGRLASWEAAWRWASGGQPLLERGEELRLDDKRVRQFLEENRPYERRRAVDEAAFLLNAREPPPYTATISNDGKGRTRARLTYGDDDGEH